MACLVRTAMLTAVCCCLCGVDAFYKKPRNYDAKLIEDKFWAPTPALVDIMGYVVEEHEVQTPDGYLLTMHRIPRAKRDWANDTLPHRTPVIMGHGLGANSEEWVVIQDRNLVKRLVNAGFDVWLGNFRGSVYSRKHVTLSVKSPKFWDFSWHENGVIDQRSMIDYILKKTGRSKLLTVGHSMSSTAMAVLLAEEPEYIKEKVIANVLMAAPGFFTKPSGVLLVLKGLFQAIPQFRTSTGRLVMNDKMPFTDQTLIEVCYPASSVLLRTYCKVIFAFAAGEPDTPYSNSDFQAFLTHYPAGASVRQVMQYAQSIMKGGDFVKYDYGKQRNQELYGSPQPPPYNLSAVSTPVHIICGKTDSLVTVEDCHKFAATCANVKELFVLPNEHFNHFDFVLGKEEVDSFVLRALQKYI